MISPIQFAVVGAVAGWFFASSALGIFIGIVVGASVQAGIKKFLSQ